MSHVGNDIVDLKTPGAIGKSSDIRFIKRVLNPEEQQLVFNSDHPDAHVWAFWAAKETAFKAVSKSAPDITSAPRRYTVRYQVKFDSGKASSTLCGIVTTPHGSVRVKAFITEAYVHCIGITGPENRLESIVYGSDRINMNESQSKTESISDQESLSVRRLIKMNIAHCLQLKAQDIQIIRHETQNRLNPPMVYVKDKKQDIDISLSHDGRFAAYAFIDL